MLSTNEMSRICKEVLLHLPLTLTTDEALAFRAEVSDEIVEMEQQGIVPDLPIEIDMEEPPRVPRRPLPFQAPSIRPQRP